MSGAAVRFVDVGQGDCVIAGDKATGEGLMMDCPAGGEQRALVALNKLGVFRLRIAIASHEHLDHLGGVYGVVMSVPTEKVKVNYPTSIPAEQTERKKLRAAIRAISGLPRKGIAVEAAIAGDSGQVGAVAWRILAPDSAQLFHASATGRPNHASVVLRLSVDSAHLIASSDADAESWEAMATRREPLLAQVLQIPHHGGSPSSSGTGWSTLKLVQEVAADICVISVGSRNNYGHPSATTLATLRALLPKGQLLCTQLNQICAGCRVPSDTACAGSITFECGSKWTLVEPSPRRHKAYVERLPAAQCI
jgi:competence protein ComEC